MQKLRLTDFLRIDFPIFPIKEFFHLLSCHLENFPKSLLCLWKSVSGAYEGGTDPGSPLRVSPMLTEKSAKNLVKKKMAD